MQGRAVLTCARGGQRRPSTTRGGLQTIFSKPLSCLQLADFTLKS